MISRIIVFWLGGFSCRLIISFFFPGVFRFWAIYWGLCHVFSVEGYSSLISKLTFRSVGAWYRDSLWSCPCHYAGHFKRQSSRHPNISWYWPQPWVLFFHGIFICWLTVLYSYFQNRSVWCRNSSFNWP